MTDAIHIFVGVPAALQPFKAIASDVRFYTLTPDADLVVLLFDDELQDRLHSRFGTGDWPENQAANLSTTDQAFAAECSRHGPLAYLQSESEAGATFQSAALWQNGALTIGPAALDLGGANAGRAASLRPINVALRALGVTALPARDEAMAFGLADFTSNADIRARGWPLRA